MTRFSVAAVAASLVLLAACDKDPTQPDQPLALTGCPVSTDVNAPLQINFTSAIATSTVTSSNIVVSAAETGFEIPGALTTAADGQSVTFTPSSPFRFSEVVRVRVQNVRSDISGRAIPITLCEFTTPPPPITELFWSQLPNAGGTRLVGASLVAPDRGFVLSQQGVLSRRFDTGEFLVTFQEPRFYAGLDLDFVSPTRGFASFSDFRFGRSQILETRNGGADFDTLEFIPGSNVARLLFRSTGAATTDLFGVMGGGSTFITAFYKLNPVTGAFTSQAFSSGVTGQVNDLDFASNNTFGAAVSAGVFIPPFDVRGSVFVSQDGGTSWTELSQFRADTLVQTFVGVAVRNNGDIYVSGGNGFLGRIRAGTTPGTHTLDTIRLVVPAPNDDDDDEVDDSDRVRGIYEELIFTDVQFARDNDLIGWVIGAQLIGEVGGVPRYQGLIFQTRDGGTTWTRQGVAGAENYGAEFARLNRIEVFSSSEAWLVGDGGTVLSFEPQ